MQASSTPIAWDLFPGNPFPQKLQLHCVQRLIDATDRDIDHLVYDLYDLTKGEIAIVEGGGGVTNGAERSAGPK